MGEKSRPGAERVERYSGVISEGVPDKAHLLDLMPGMIAYFDADMRFRYVNQLYADWRGAERRSIVGQHCRDVLGDANFAAVRKWMDEALSGKTVSFEYDMITEAGRRRVQGEYVPDTDADGTVIGVMALVTDLSSRQELHRKVAESEALFEDAFSNSPIGMALVDTMGVIIRANSSFCRMLERSGGELDGMNFADITHPDDMDLDLGLFRQVLCGSRDGYKIDKRYLKTDGGVVETTLTVTAMRNPAGEIVRFISQIEDITEQRQAERRLIETNAELSLAVELVSGGFWHMDVASLTFRTSERLAKFVAGAEAEPLDLAGYTARINPEDLQNSDLRPLIEGAIDRVRSEYRLATEGGERWMRCDRRLVRDDSGRPAKIVGMAIDITRERDQIRRTQHEADTDSLTGILNRRGFEKRYRRMRSDYSCGLLALDLDGFKQVNDRLGHHTGDLVLVEVARRLKAAVREGDMVARLGGDEFVITLVDGDERLNRTVAERIRSSLCLPIELDRQTVDIGSSIGTAWFKAWPEDMPGALSRADAALYRAKAAGKNTWRAG